MGNYNLVRFFSGIGIRHIFIRQDFKMIEGRVEDRGEEVARTHPRICRI